LLSVISSVSERHFCTYKFDQYSPPERFKCQTHPQALKISMQVSLTSWSGEPKLLTFYKQNFISGRYSHHWMALRIQTLIYFLFSAQFIFITYLSILYHLVLFKCRITGVFISIMLTAYDIKNCKSYNFKILCAQFYH
jgi:hypothetical protein